MENYGTIFFRNDKKIADIEEFVTNSVLANLDITLEEINENGEIVELSVMGGSSTEDNIESAMESLSKHNFNFVKAYITGDEDPWCMLLWVENNIVRSEDISGGIYEYIAECEDSELDDYEDLRDAKEKGPSLYFTEKLDSWKQGIESCDLSEIESEVTSIINYSNF
ncbi:hypothetical protein [Pleionea mediterranea]|uniref:Uncharacterized protein n=1 Tax=Pleionea mediterranea TaxID=523701 RepID=A0A316F4P0_9GAMM|nr:hypothetical protein [Pleionea mediterranea]PWK40566.1 hypothetical protein C8D97_1263 [Pleionea mediterranea]